MPSDNTTQLQKLIDRMNAGDDKAVNELIERACERLRRLTSKIFQSYQRARQYEDTGDVLTEVLLRLTRRLQNLMKPSAPHPLPESVKDFFDLSTREIRCAFLDLIRRYFGPHGAGKNEVPQPEKGNDSSQQGPAEDPSDHSHDPQRLVLWTAFHEQVEALPDEEREVFKLRWYQDLSSAEVAEVLNIGLSTVNRRWLQARLLLQPALERLL